MQTLEDVLGSHVNLAVLRYLSAVSGDLSGNVVVTSAELSTPKVEALAREARRDGMLVLGKAPAEPSGVPELERPKGDGGK